MERVLLVDDEQEFLDTLSERMTNRGLEVSKATTGKQALQKVEEENFDAVILDMMMPDMNGIETLKVLKLKNPELQIILLTGHATVEKGLEAMKLGAMDFIEKPADIDTLMDKIHKAQARKIVLVEEHNKERIRQIIQEKGW